MIKHDESTSQLVSRLGFLPPTVPLPCMAQHFFGNTFKADLITASPGGTAISGTLLNSNMAEELQNLLPVLEPKIQI